MKGWRDRYVLPDLLRNVEGLGQLEIHASDRCEDLLSLRSTERSVFDIQAFATLTALSLSNIDLGHCWSFLRQTVSITSLTLVDCYSQSDLSEEIHQNSPALDLPLECLSLFQTELV